MSACALPSAPPKARSALEEVSAEGSFKRVASVYRSQIGEDPRFPAEPKRYRLYVSYACPWACRCLAALYMKGLEDVINVSITHPTWRRTKPESPSDQHCGWCFRDPSDPPISSEPGYGSFPCDGCIPDTANGFRTVRALYEAAQDTGGKYTVPVLWDEKTKTIVNNESSEIIRMLNSAFNALARNPTLDLYPTTLREKIDAVNDWVYANINDGVYRCGFAKSQVAYNQAVHALYEHLDKAEALLSGQRYLCGDQLTEADIRLFVTLIRFDEVYVVYFKCNKKAVREYPNLLNYTRDVYQHPGVAASVNMQHIKTHYFTSHTVLNPYAIIPEGPAVDWTAPHHREHVEYVGK